MSAPQLPEDLLNRLLSQIRTRFYQGRDKFYYQERKILLQSLTWPARWLDDKGARLPVARYRQILTTVFTTILERGDLGKIRSFGRYFLHSTQQHMLHHGEEYYAQAKAITAVADDTFQGIRRQTSRARAEQADGTVPTLAEIHRTLCATKAGRRKGKATLIPQQGDLFS